jgi:argininosuccinate lyase
LAALSARHRRIDRACRRAAAAGIISADEREKIDNGLRAIKGEIENGKFQWDESLEDVHMNISRPHSRIGAAETTQRAVATTKSRSICGFM